MRPFTVKTEGNFAKKSVCDARATIVIDPEKKRLFVLFYHLLEFYSFIISFFSFLGSSNLCVRLRVLLV